MKNKLGYVFIIFLMCFISIGNVYALGINMRTEAASENVKKGETRTIDLKLTTDEVVSSCQFKLESDANLVAGEIKSLGGWSYTGNATDGITITKPTDSTDIPENLGVLQMVYTVNGNGKVIIKDVKCVSEADSTEHVASNLEVNFTAVENDDDTYLKSLSIVGGMAIDFKSDKFDYATTVDMSKFSLEYETKNPDYQDKVVVKDVNGNIISDLKEIIFYDPSGQAKMVLKITVNGKTTYEVMIYYVKKELDNSLSFVKVNGSNLLLEKDKLEYNLDVDNDVDNVEFSIGLKDSQNFQIGGNSNIDRETLKGIFSITDVIDVNIIVEPKDASIGATSKTYTIHVRKKDAEEPVVVPPKEDITTNPSTGDISMFIMLVILIGSLVGSIILYKKNMESYR